MKCKRGIPLALLALMLVMTVAWPCQAQASGDLGLNRSNRKVGTAGGVTLAEANGTLTFGYGKMRLDLAGSGLNLADGASAGEALELVKDFGDAACVTQTYESASLETQYLPQEDGTMRLMQTARSREGVSSVRFRLVVPLRYDIIIPAWNGIRLTAENAAPYMSRMPYPNVWQAQMILIQAENGGLLVHAMDDGTQFKALNISSDEQYFYIDMETIPQAPFTQYEEFTTVEWALVPYEGDWMRGALTYKAYAEELFHTQEIQAAKPNWADDIQLVLLMDVVDKPLADALAKLVDPAKTVLHLVNWRTSNYDMNYPDYSVRPGLKEGIDYAHALGFKVSVHANMLGAHLDNDDYIREHLEDAAVLDAVSGEMVIEGYTAFGTTYAFSQQNQANTVWQDVLIRQLTQVVEETGVDIIHLDQSLLCFNDGRGLVNGMTTMQGNVELQRRLAEALPGVVFSGEGVNEFNARYASLLQQHVYGLDNAAQTWSETWFDQICPLTTVLFGDNITFYHYPALPTTREAQEEYYQAWFRAGNQRAFEIPCLYRIGADDLLHPTRTTELVLWDAIFRMTCEPRLDTESVWGEDVLLSLKRNDGKIAQWRRSENGSYFLEDISQPEDVAVRFLTGVESAAVAGRVDNWRLYDGERIFGLNPEKSYLVSHEERDLEATHIAEAEKNITLRAFEENEDYALVAVQEIVSTSERVINLLKYDGEMRAGEDLTQGVANQTPTFNSMTNFGFLLPSQAQIRHYNDRLFMHPPWINETDNIGYAWMEADIDLEIYGSTVFTASPQMGSAVNAAMSDGVLYRFMVWAKDDTEKANMLVREVHVTSKLGTPISMDLTQFEGQTITLRIECDPYKTTGNDSSAVVAPQVVQSRGHMEKIAGYTLHTAREVETFLSLSGKAEITPLGESNYAIAAPVSDTIYAIYQNQPLQGFADLTCLPYVSTWLMQDGITKIVQEGLAPLECVAEVGDEMRNGLMAQPPEDGAVTLNYLVALPEETMRFYAALGVKNGAVGSDGATFVVKVNNQVMLEQKVLPGKPFEEVIVPLDDFARQTVLLTMEVHAGDSSTADYIFIGDPCLERQ